VKKNRNPDTIHSPFSTYSHQIEIINENRLSYENIVKLTIYFVNDSIDTDDRRRLFKELFGSILPCMTVLYVSALGDSDMKVELDVWASAEGPGR